MMQVLDAFTQAYLECALFTSNDETTPSGGFPLDKNYNILDFSDEAIAKAQAECDLFQRENSDALESAGSDSRNGRDFWLTRNRHGAGFWCRGYDEDICRILTDASHAYMQCHAYIGDDGKIHLG